MIDEQVDRPAPIELRLRDLHIRSWLAVLRETASHLVHGDVRDGKLCVYSVADNETLINVEWGDSRISVQVPGELERCVFETIQGALGFLDGLVEYLARPIHRIGADTLV